MPLTITPIIVVDGVVDGGGLVLRGSLELANFEPSNGNRMTIFVVLYCLTVFPNALVVKIDILTLCKLFLASIIMGGFSAFYVVM